MNPALLLPLRFVDTSKIDDSFDGNFSNEQAPEWKLGEKCYLQKYQRNDRLVLQLISDEVLSDLKILDQYERVVLLISWTTSEIILEGYPDFVIYEIDYDLNGLQEGIYIVQQDNLEAEAIDLRNSHPNTLRITYNNSENDKDVVFDTGIIFQMRVEAWIGNYVPKNQRDVYLNQEYSPTQLKSIAHRQFTLYVGFQVGVPEWVLDKVNIITQCDEVLYNNIKYQPIQDAEFEKLEEELTTFIGGTIDIEPTNKFTKFVTVNNPQEQTFIPMQKVDKYLNRSANFSVPSKFKFNSVLEYLNVYVYSDDPITINIGTTNGGNDIGTFDVEGNGGHTYTIKYSFFQPTTVYISGINGADVDIWLVWKQLDELPVPFVSNPIDALKKGAMMIWTGSSAEFSANWEASTGLGKPNTGWEKWTIAGKNGTVNMDNSYPVGIDTLSLGQDYSTLGNTIGANEKQIVRANLPAEGLGMFTPDVVTSSSLPGTNDKVARARSKGGSGTDFSLNYELSKGASTGFVGKSAENLGQGTNFNVQPKSIVSLWIVKIMD